MRSRTLYSTCQWREFPLSRSPPRAVVLILPLHFCQASPPDISIDLFKSRHSRHVPHGMLPLPLVTEDCLTASNALSPVNACCRHNLGGLSFLPKRLASCLYSMSSQSCMLSEKLAFMPSPIILYTLRCPMPCCSNLMLIALCHPKCRVASERSRHLRTIYDAAHTLDITAAIILNVADFSATMTRPTSWMSLPPS